MIDKTKQYRTRDGREVRIYATDHAGEYPVCGAVYDGRGWDHDAWTLDGKYFNKAERCSPDDLIEVTPEHTCWIVAHMGTGYDTQAKAQQIAREIYTDIPVAVVPVTFREGDGL